MQSINGIGSLFLRQGLKWINVSRPYISKVLCTDVNLSFGTAAKLARALEMDFFPELRERLLWKGNWVVVRMVEHTTEKRRGK